MLFGLNSNFMALIPKMDGANSIDKSRPIIFSNFVFKVTTKILADMLAAMPSPIIRGRHIEDCIATASKCIHMLNNRCFGGNMVVKIDMRKAFDIMDWILF